MRARLAGDPISRARTVRPRLSRQELTVVQSPRPVLWCTVFLDSVLISLATDLFGEPVAARQRDKSQRQKGLCTHEDVVAQNRCRNNWPLLLSDEGDRQSMSADDRQTLLEWARSRTMPVRVVLRSRIVLAIDRGRGVVDTALSLGVSPATVRLWSRRVRVHGAASVLSDAPGRGRKPVLDRDTRERLSGTDRQRSVRELARELGVSPATVSRWRRVRDGRKRDRE